MKPILIALCGALLSGCTMLESITAATKDKTVAAGSDTWGGGGEISAAAVDQPVPNGNFWFGRRKVWYTSVKDAATGNAAATIVKAGNSSLSVAAGASGVELKQ